MRELFREFHIGKDRDLDRYDERVTLAWCVAAFERQKKLPKLESLLSRRKPQTVADQRAVMQAIAQGWGLKLRKASKKPKQPKGSH